MKMNKKKLKAFVLAMAKNILHRFMLCYVLLIALNGNYTQDKIFECKKKKKIQVK